MGASVQETTETVLDSHECGWRDEIVRQLLGGNVVSRAYRDSETPDEVKQGLLLSPRHLKILAKIHEGGVCPPTHSGPTSPYREWADHVQTDFTKV